MRCTSTLKQSVTWAYDVEKGRNEYTDVGLELVAGRTRRWMMHPPMCAVSIT